MKGLLAAISQNYARKYKTSIDMLEFKYDIVQSKNLNGGGGYEEVNVDDLFTTVDGLVTRAKDTMGLVVKPEGEREDEGILLCGFYIDGGRWDSLASRLVDSPQRFSPLPHFLCRMIQVTSKPHKKNNHLIFIWIILIFKEGKVN